MPWSTRLGALGDVAVQVFLPLCLHNHVRVPSTQAPRQRGGVSEPPDHALRVILTHSIAGPASTPQTRRGGRISIVRAS